MGCGPSFDIGYGYVFEDEGEPLYGWDLDDVDIDYWVEVIAEKRGMKGRSWEHEQELSDEFDVVVFRFGAVMDGYTTPVVAAKSSHVSSYSYEPWFPTEVDLQRFTYATDMWDRSLKEFVDEVGIDVSKAKGPCWFVVPTFG